MRKVFAFLLAVAMLVSASGACAASRSSGTQALLSSIDTLALHGWILNCGYRVRSDTIDDLKDEYGRPDSEMYVKSAKGTYVDYNDLYFTAGYDVGGRLFELRSSDPRVTKLSLDDVEEYYGVAEHINRTSTERFDSYVLSDEINIKFVYNRSGTHLKHYNIIWLEGTQNNRADDPGRDW